MTAVAPDRPRILPGLDGLRGIAVLSVLVAHLGEFLAPALADRLLPGGFLGVDVFFVLSGFLITGLLVDAAGAGRGVGIRRFWRRRVVRLFPALAVLAIAYLAISSWSFDDPLGPTLRTFAWSFALMANWQLSFGVQPPLALLHLWTLSVEGQFYLLAPLAALVVVRRRVTPRTVTALLVAGIAASAAIRAIEWARWQDPGVVYTRTDARADAILMGALLAILWRTRPRWVAAMGRLAPVGAVGLVAFAIVAHPGDPWLFQGGFTLVALLSATVVAGTAAAPGRLDAALAWSPLRLIGRMSYSIYLWHLPIYLWTLRWSGGPDPWFGAVAHGDAGRMAVALVLTAAAATVSYVLVEVPVLRRWRR